MKSNFLISLTSIPRRLDGSLLEVLATLKKQSLKCDILVNIPKAYRKWGPVQLIPSVLRNLEDVVVFSPSVDYGPATKLLGALEYIQDRPEITHVITVDDDMLIDDPKHLAYLAKYSEILPDCAITFGGIKLEKFPFRHGDGLTYERKFSFVDAPAGYKGVLYPMQRLRNSRVPFEFSNNLPPGVFNDDDAYFGIVLSTLNIPLFAIPKRPRGSEIKSSPMEGGSAVVELAQKERTQNEMEIFQFAVSHGYFPNPTNDVNHPLDFGKRLRLFATYIAGGLSQLDSFDWLASCFSIF